MILVGVDVGGTFTDLILANTDEGRVAIHKLPTTSPDPSAGVISGVQELCSRERVPLSRLDYLFHGTTVATNAMLEHKGARTGMITTRGYRDIVHIGRHQRPQNYSIMQDIPWQNQPLVQRRHRKVVSERLTPPAGDVLVALDEAETRERIRELKEEGVEAVAVCFLFSYLNAAHEKRVSALVEEEFPGAFVTASAEVSPQFREFERFTTACMNAFLGPRVQGFVRGLERRLQDSGVKGDVHIMTSNGGVATAHTISEKPVYSLLSGLAAGVRGGDWVGRHMGRSNMITFDVGGTSADIGIVTSAGITEASPRDTRIAGYPVMVPMIDVHTIGAGGGSIAYVDAGGAFRVGPRSAGSQPGPACYGQGGEEPTVTDANVVLGRLDRDHFLGGAMNIYPERSFAAIEKLAQQLGLGLYETADGVNTILASNMANAIRSRTVQKGHDPRHFSLVAFGGAGPMTAVQVAEHLKIPEVIVPVYPGITSAMGLLTSDLKYDFTRTELLVSANRPGQRLNRDIEELQREAQEQLLRDGVAAERIQFARSLDLRYLGQGYELRVPLPGPRMEDAEWEGVWAEFHRRHRVEYGHAFPGTPVEIVSLRVSGIGLMPKLEQGSLRPGGRGGKPLLKTVDTWFRVHGELRKAPAQFLDREALQPGNDVEGPAVLIQRDTTTVVPPHWGASVAESGDLVLARIKNGAAA
jgi:N-methylhydantoinase A